MSIRTDKFAEHPPNTEAPDSCPIQRGYLRRTPPRRLTQPPFRRRLQGTAGVLQGVPAANLGSAGVARATTLTSDSHLRANGSWPNTMG